MGILGPYWEEAGVLPGTPLAAATAGPPTAAIAEACPAPRDAPPPLRKAPGPHGRRRRAGQPGAGAAVTLGPSDLQVRGGDDRRDVGGGGPGGGHGGPGPGPRRPVRGPPGAGGPALQLRLHQEEVSDSSRACFGRSIDLFQLSLSWLL